MSYDQRTAPLLLACLLGINLFANSPNADTPAAGMVVLTEDSVDESAGGIPAFKIETATAIYYLEKTGGGLSSLVDRNGQDWLGFSPEKNSGAGGEYRGFPNAVYRQKGNYFHPRNAATDPMNSVVERAEDDYVAITFESRSGHWAGRYEFFATHCTFTMTRVPDGSKYWVLYEGTPGGELDLDDWWMTSATTLPQPITQRHEGDIPSPEWMAFGDAGGKRSLVLMNHADDNHPDAHYQMRGKMTVFGFGRRALEAFHTRPGQRFSIGIVETVSHKAISTFAGRMNSIKYRTTEESCSTLSEDSDLSQNLGPKPGDVYREYAIHNGGNLNWRVTDPNAPAEGAQRFLPNPVLEFNVNDLQGATRAEAMFDRWGGHAGTKDKKIRFNENTWLTLPELMTTPSGHDPERYHSQDNPLIAVPLTHLLKGTNTIEGTVGPKNRVHWGQWGLYSMILRIYYDPVRKGFSNGKIIAPVSGELLKENPAVKLTVDEGAKRIDVLAWYDGYDEDGNGIYDEWHGSRFQPLRGHPAALRDHVGTISPSSRVCSLTWDTHWIPDQKPKSIKLGARIHNKEGLIFVTDTVEGLHLKRDGWSVRQYRAHGVPEAFSVRVGQSKSCTISIDDGARLERATEAVLHYRTWEALDSHHEPFQLNGHKHKNQGKNHHYDYDLLPIPVTDLKTGDNMFTIQSKTKHHMLEVLWPGPAITVRYRTD